MISPTTGEANKISATFPYQKQRRRVLGGEMAYVEVRQGDPIVLLRRHRAPVARGARVLALVGLGMAVGLGVFMGLELSILWIRLPIRLRLFLSTLVLSV